MADTVNTIKGQLILVCDPAGKQIAGESDAVDLIGEMLQTGAEWIVIPVERLTADFFELKTRLAGNILQKFVTYRRRLAILGDISQYTSESRSFHDFVYEANQGQQIWFVADLAELAEKLHRL